MSITYHPYEAVSAVHPTTVGGANDIDQITLDGSYSVVELLNCDPAGADIWWRADGVDPVAHGNDTKRVPAGGWATISATHHTPGWTATDGIKVVSATAAEYTVQAIS